MVEHINESETLNNQLEHCMRRDNLFLIFFLALFTLVRLRYWYCCDNAKHDRILYE